MPVRPPANLTKGTEQFSTSSASGASARRAADALTIITTCKKLGHDPRRYTRDTLRRILAGEKDVNALLPENYKPDVEPTAASLAGGIAA